jgi:hypothetical protein
MLPHVMAQMETDKAEPTTSGPRYKEGNSVVDCARHQAC